ncbi:hypothetical protein SNEBB_006681 [Seison nebaliae]|nr:hypothetical protein SNEBB_006681 [Seison nebaliae]
MNIVKSLIYKDIFRVDSATFPYMDYEDKVKKGRWCWGDTSSELQQCSYNSIGSCEFIALISVIRSAPYFMYYLYSYHKNDNWEKITKMVDERISQPDLKINTPPTLAGNYLAMELLKTSTVYNPGKEDKPQLFRRNYLEYFSLLVGYASIKQRQLGIFDGYLKNIYSYINFPYITDKLNRKHMKKSYNDQRRTKGNFFRIIYENLFPTLDNPLFFKDYKSNNSFHQIDDPFKNISLHMYVSSNILSFYPQINFWFLSLVGELQVHESVAHEPIHEKVNPVNLLHLISDQAKDQIYSKGKAGLPFWMQVETKMNQQNYFWSNHKRGRYFLGYPYYLKLFRILNNYRYFSHDIIKNQILNLPIERQLAHSCFDENSQLTNIPIFDRIFPNNTENYHYDVTGILFGIIPSVNMIDFSSGVPQLKIGPNMKNGVNMCTKKIFQEIHQFQILIGDKKMRAVTDELYNDLKHFLENLFDLYCAHSIGYIKGKEKKIKKYGHALALIRSLEKNNWYHVSNDNVAPIENIKDIIYAYRTERLLSYQLSKIGNHDHYVNLWEMARGVHSQQLFV